jgi:hypothetical protein
LTKLTLAICLANALANKPDFKGESKKSGKRVTISKRTENVDLKNTK